MSHDHRHPRDVTDAEVALRLAAFTVCGGDAEAAAEVLAIVKLTVAEHARRRAEGGD